MEENKNIDGLFKSSLEKFEMAPTTGIWSSMDIELTKKLNAKAGKKKRRFLLLLLLLLLIPAYFFLIPGNTDNEVIHKSDRSKIEFGSQGKSNITLNNKIDISQAEKIDSIQAEKLDSIHTAKSPTIQNSAKSATILPSQPEKNSSNNAKSEPSSSKLAKSFKKATKTVDNKANKTKEGKSVKYAKAKIKTAITFEDVKGVDKKVSDGIQTNKLVENSSVYIERKDVKGNTIDSVTLNSSDQTKTNASSVLIENSTEEINKINKPIDSVQLVVNNELKKDTVKLVNSLAEKGKETKDDVVDESIKLRKSDFKNGLYVDISLSPIYTINYLRNNTSYNSADDAIDYSSREKSKFSFSTGMALRYDLNNKWGISLGAYYSTIAYSMALSTVYALKNASNEVHFQYPTSWGTIEIPNQPGQSLKIGDSLTLNSSCNQLIKVVNIPLLFRYTISNSRFSLYTNVGVSANFTVKEDAVIKTGSFEFSYTNSLIGKRKINCSLLLGLGMQYKVTNRLAIFMEPIYRASITSVTQDIPVNCYPQSFGISTGLSIQLR